MAHGTLLGRQQVGRLPAACPGPARSRMAASIGTSGRWGHSAAPTRGEEHAACRCRCRSTIGAIGRIAAPDGCSLSPSTSSSSWGAVLTGHAWAQPGRGVLRRGASATAAAALPSSSSGGSSGGAGGPLRSLFPAGATQARVVLPAIVLQVGAGELLSGSTGGRVVEQLGGALRAGATAVALREDAAGLGASGLYEAAVRLKELVASRAALLVVDRVDIAQAVEADGVLLTDAGMPTVVARRMLAAGGGGLIGRVTSSVQAAVQAAADGANLVLLQGADGGPPSSADLAAARTQQRSGNSIPVLLTSTSPSSSSGLLSRLAEAWAGAQQQLPASSRGGGVPAEGVALDLAALPLAAAALSGAGEAGAWLPLDEAVATLATALKGGFAAPPSASTSGPAAAAAAAGSSGTNGSGSSKASSTSGSSRSSSSSRPASSSSSLVVERSSTSTSSTSAPSTSATTTWARRLLAGSASEQLLTDEHQALGQVMAFLEEVVPELSELSLLRDAMRQLDEPFLVVVVGEFNSGKSSVINALLGRKFLAEGILPTTNEISVLRFSDEPGAERKLQQQADGLYVRYLPARLLQEMQIVDTPGTNVILERQQRLTEEYVPRADLVLFVMSADRPFSESEVRFLEYIRQWRKKVVFVVNKADMLETYDEVEQVKSFVADNARRLLRLDDPPVIAVSSRAAIRAKMAAAMSNPQARVVGDFEASALARSPEWQASGFGTFEQLIYAFLVGTNQQATVSGAGEGVRLKLQTPLFVADALVGAAGKKLSAELAAAEAELASARSIKAQLARFRGDMEKDASAQRDALLKVLGSVTGRMDAYIDRTLALSNALSLLEYITGPKASAAAGTQQLSGASLAKFEAEAVGGSFDRVRDAVAEHSSWLQANCEAQRAYYRSFVEQRIEEARAQDRDMREVELALAGMPGAQGGALATTPASTSSEVSLASADFDITSASNLLEAEMREAVVGTATAAVGAPALGLVVTSIIDNAFEDLLVLGAAGAAAYASVLNLPLRRAEIKNKVAKLASQFVEGVQGHMQSELQAQLDGTTKVIERLAGPLEAAASEEVARLQALEDQRQELAAQLQSLMQRAANLA